MTLYPLSSNNNNSDPYPQYLTQDEAKFYAENLAQDAVNASFGHTDNMIATHIAASNPHNITPDLINAANKTHTHHYSDIAGRHTHYYNDIIDRRAQYLYDNPTLSSGWYKYHIYYNWSFRVLAGTLVAVNGLVKRVRSNNNVIFSFDPMYAPPSQRLFSTWGVVNNSYTQCRVDVTERGVIMLVYPLSNPSIGWLSLDGLIWFTK